MMRKRLDAMASLFVKITTGILFASAVFITVFYGWELELHVDILWQILVLAFICTLGSLVISVDGQREISRRSMLIRIAVYYAYVNAAVLFGGFLFRWFSFDNLNQVLGMVAAVAVVYLAVWICSSWLDYREAEQINRKLERYFEGRKNMNQNMEQKMKHD
ncbi:DUF3021 domain-containing protein [Petralouisia muris]|uniref:DUF3021 domain-containing protein n=1 Tax=Petralouisia muris TaxID=3032872 RepID=A0AC61RUT5_9FIRM|nr:DUF3021 family protein [Petralouisia muris]TGY95584.1 DUF3021 domain-containing protein [Petralouisia muris]